MVPSFSIDCDIPSTLRLDVLLLGKSTKMTEVSSKISFERVRLEVFDLMKVSNAKLRYLNDSGDKITLENTSGIKIGFSFSGKFS